MGLFSKKKNKTAEEVRQDQAKEPDLQAMFAENLKYISQTKLSAKDIERQFVKSQTRFYLTVGNIDCPTGEIIVSDPLCYLAAGDLCPRLAIKIPPGCYPVDVSLCRNPYVGIRMCTARLKIKDTKALSYVCAEPTPESAIGKCADGDLTGFPVDAGMMSFCDSQVAEEYRIFLDNWHGNNPDKNHYDDYFADYFEKSAEALPAYQRDGGDFIEWANPDTGHRMVMIGSGFGDGFYQSYWGYDDSGEICELIVPMINPDIIEYSGNTGSKTQTKNFAKKAGEIENLFHWDEPEGCFATDRIVVDGAKVGYMYREKPDAGSENPDSGWRFFAGDESDDYANDPNNVGIYALNTIANYDPDIIQLLDSPYGTAFGRDKNGVFKKER